MSEGAAMPFADINRVILVGRLTRDPDLRALPSGAKVCKLRIVCNGVRKDGDVYKERPYYFDVNVFGADGENVERNLRKSSRVALAGRLDWREWETTAGDQRQAVSIVADSVQCLDSQGNGQEDGGTLDARHRM